MRSASRLVQAIEADNVAAVYKVEQGGPVVSANLCDAILRMQPPDARSQVQLTVSWASTRRERPGAIPHKVTFQADYFPIIEDIYRELRPPMSPAESVFVGYVDTLNGHPGPDGRMQGETRFLLVGDQEEILRARTYLGPEDYQTALRAHGGAQIVRFRGILHRGRRVHRITDVVDFQILPPEPSLGARRQDQDGSRPS